MNFRLINGDAMEILVAMRSSVKVIFADIPDNIGLDYDTYADKIPMIQYYLWVQRLIEESLAKCSIFWLSYNVIHDLEIKHMIRNILRYRNSAWDFKEIIWYYTFSQHNNYDTANSYRPIIRLRRADAQIYPDKIREDSARILVYQDPRANPAGRVPDNVWKFPRIVGNASERCKWIPTQHPIRLLQRIIRLCCDENDWILDPFAGSGSCLRAAKLEKRNCISFEMSKNYCEHIATETGVPYQVFDGSNFVL